MPAYQRCDKWTGDVRTEPRLQSQPEYRKEAACALSKGRLMPPPMVVTVILVLESFLRPLFRSWMTICHLLRRDCTGASSLILMRKVPPSG